MESINERLERIMQFLSIVQTACDNKRSFMEQQTFKSYTLYLEERKTEQRKTEKEMELVHNIKESPKVDALTHCVEEISLADALLGKARAIRCKNKGLIKETVKSDKFLSDGKAKEVRNSCVNSNTKSCQKELLKNSHKHRYTLPHCKSTLNAKSYKTCKITHSKSFEESIAKRESNVPNSNSSNSKTKITKNMLKFENGTSTEADIQFVTTKQYNELKCIAHAQNFPPSQQKEKNKDENHFATNSGSPLRLTVQSPLSFPSFRSHLKSTLKLKPNFQIQQNGYWYPNINSKNKKCLFKWTKCSSLESLTKVIKLMYKIQEAMLWIDLLNLFETDIMPYVKILDDTNKHTIRFCHYFSSIYHESLQRIPMLNYD